MLWQNSVWQLKSQFFFLFIFFFCSEINKRRKCKMSTCVIPTREHNETHRIHKRCLQWIFRVQLIHGISLEIIENESKISNECPTDALYSQFEWNNNTFFVVVRVLVFGKQSFDAEAHRMNARCFAYDANL